MLQIMKKAARAAGKIQLDHFRKVDLQIADKAHKSDLLTEADIASQKIIHQIILDELNKKGIPSEDIGFIGEEDLHHTGRHTFIIDPIDGTSNFATGNDEFCTLIGYMYDGELQAGIMYFPVKDWMYIGEKGNGASVIKQQTEHPLEIERHDLQTRFLYTSLSYPDDFEAKLGEKMYAFQKMFRAIRMIGCAGSELGLLAENVAGASILVGCSIWDIAPGKLILEELGYTLVDWDGKELEFDLTQPKKKYPFIACHPDHVEEITAVLS